MVEHAFRSLSESDESQRLVLGSHHRLGVTIFCDTLPSGSELARNGKHVRRIKERWASLQPEHAPAEVFQVSRFPGTRQHALLAMFRPVLARFATWGDLLHADIGAWTDVQLFDGPSLVGWSLREERFVSRLGVGVAAPPWRDAFGELQPLSPEWLQYLAA